MSLSFAILYTAEGGVIIQAYSPARQISGWITAFATRNIPSSRVGF